LNDDVLCVAHDADTLALDYTLGALTNQGLVGANRHTKDTSLVICDTADLGRIGLVVLAPVIFIDGLLTCRASSPRSTTITGDLAFGSAEVKGLSEDNDTRRGVRKVVLELSDRVGVDWCGIASSSYA
jgi:hypothetical protein